ncbi:unnamed protein product [Cuscuta campestris]|uniref:Uncharacterized protein n=1 Tax=Cuscuta campestris TaxID=132261 RepID=A0A484N494_9ASTE|nr:unnamed protein product [Cuscuta campestris]
MELIYRAGLRIVLTILIAICNMIAFCFAIGAGVLQKNKVNGSSSDECHASGLFIALWVASFLILVFAMLASGTMAWSLHNDAIQLKGKLVIICVYVSIVMVFIAEVYLLIAGIGVKTRNSFSSSACVISHPNFIFMGGGGGSVLNIILIYLYFVYINSSMVDLDVDLRRELVRQKIRLTYSGGNVGLQGAVASTVYTNGGIVRGFISGYIGTRQIYGPTYDVEYTVSSNYYKYFEMNHVVEAFIILPRGIDAMEDNAVRQNFMASIQRKLFISSFFIDELLDNLEFAKAFPGPGANYDEFVNPRRLDLELHL